MSEHTCARKLEMGESIRLMVREVCVKRGSIELISKATGARIRLRRFQEDLVWSFCNDVDRFIGLEAPTGAGKTLTIIAPLIANALCGKMYQGAVGVYPTKPLVNDQFLSVRSILERLGERLEVVKGIDGLEIAVKYRLRLRVIYGETEREASYTVGLVRLTKEALDRLTKEILRETDESLEQQQDQKVGRLILLDAIRRTLINADYLIVVAVPEYPYMMLSSTYRSVPDAYKLLDLALDGDFVYRIVKRIASAGNREELDEAVLDAKSMLTEVFEFKGRERERLNIYSALFSEVLFLDEFHVWTTYERPTVIALVLLHYFESLKSARPESYRAVFSSATPQNDMYRLIETLGLGKVKVIRAEVDSACSDSDRVKSRAIVEFVPVRTKPVSGPIAWFRVEDCIPDIVEMYRDTIVSSGRAIVFARRNAVVEEAAELFSKLTGKTPAVVTGIKTEFPGKELLEERKDGGELYVFGNYSIELGIDLRSIRFGLPYGVSVGEVIQRFGRIGRGDVDEAFVVIPVPIGYINSVLKWISKTGDKVDYATFVRILSDIMPEKLGIEALGTEFVMKHKIGRLRLYAPLAGYIMTQIYMWEYHEMLQRLCKVFVDIVEKLDITGIFGWLRKVSKRPEVLIQLASFRVSYTVPYARAVTGKAEPIEDFASLSTLLGNYDVEYSEGRVIINGISKKSLLEVLTLRCKYSPRGVYDTVITSGFLLSILGRAIEGNVTLIRILKDREVPLYITSPDTDSEVLEVFVAYGYALRFVLPTGKAFYAFIL